MDGEKFSYILGFYYANTQILGINVYIKQNKRHYALVNTKLQSHSLKIKVYSYSHIISISNQGSSQGYLLNIIIT